MLRFRGINFQGSSKIHKNSEIYFPQKFPAICDPICKNPEQSRILENSDFCTMVLCMPKGFFCSSIKSVIQIVLELQG